MAAEGVAVVRRVRVLGAGRIKAAHVQLKKMMR